jgi:hypothetical protein
MPTLPPSTRNHSRGSTVHVAFASKKGTSLRVNTSLTQSEPGLIISSERRAAVGVRTTGLRVLCVWGSVHPRIIRVSFSALGGTRFVATYLQNQITISSIHLLFTISKVHHRRTFKPKLYRDTRVLF